MKRLLLLSAFITTIAAGSFTMGCANMSRTEQRTLSGGAIGAAAGAVIGGATTGNTVGGALIGGAAGAAGGYLVEESQPRDRYRRHDRYDRYRYDRRYDP